jgi:hypothetical protein
MWNCCHRSDFGGTIAGHQLPSPKPKNPSTFQLSKGGKRLPASRTKPQAFIDEESMIFERY